MALNDESLFLCMQLLINLLKTQQADKEKKTSPAHNKKGSKHNQESKCERENERERKKERKIRIRIE